ncbi:MAG TPA: hypothetical protein VFI97_06280 [Arthrobacter sp.]|nr:hypothetical protein [Arthrobacter sp.]
MTALIAGLASSLLVAGPVIYAETGKRPVAVSSLQFPDLMGLASSVLGVGLLLWWSIALLMAFIGQLLCNRGHVILGRRVSAWSPEFMRRLVLVVLSMNLLAAPAMASAPSQDTATVQALKKQAGSGRQSSIGRTMPFAPIWQPTSHSPVTSTGTPGPRWTPTNTPAMGNVLTRGPLRNADAQIRQHTVTVQPGDSLWALCAEHLGPYATDLEIAAEWPRWYAENRQTIGADASLLLPGQILRIPTTTDA